MFFDGQLSAVRLCAVMVMVSGTWSSLSGLPDEPDTRKLSVEMPAERERRRYTLALQDDRGSERVEALLAGVSSRLRGDLLRNLIITGLALHTTAPELPRLLASLPVPPVTVSELQIIVRQMVRAEPGDAGFSESAEPENAVLPVTTSSGADTAGIKKNMRRAFGD